MSIQGTPAGSISNGAMEDKFEEIADRFAAMDGRFDALELTMDRNMSSGFNMIMDMIQGKKHVNTSQEIKNEASEEDNLDFIPQETPPSKTILPPRKDREAFLPVPIASMDTLGSNLSTPTPYPSGPRLQFQHANFRHAE
jgi:hypothetical protein